MTRPKTIYGQPFYFDDWLIARLHALDEDIRDRWEQGQFSTQIQRQLYEQTKLDEVYHSNRIEGNRLTYGETKQVIQNGDTISGKPTIDQREAINLSRALDYAQDVALDKSKSVAQKFLREFHALLLADIQKDAGNYRKTPNIITDSSYATPDAFFVQQLMTDLSDYVVAVTSSSASMSDYPIFCSAAAHTWFVQIHAFSDGNGRTARALMNLILRRNGYPPCIILEDDRPRYIDSLEHSWENGDLSLLIELMHENISDQMKDVDLLNSLQSRLEIAEVKNFQREYNSWRAKMDYLKATFEYFIGDLSENNISIHGRVHTFGNPVIEKYVLLQKGGKVVKSWFFGIEFSGLAKRSRYLFFFASPLGAMKGRTPVVLVAAKYSDSEDKYISLYNLNRDGTTVPDIFQIGYDLNKRKFITNGKAGIRERNPQNLVLQFFKQVIERDFGV